MIKKKKKKTEERAHVYYYIIFKLKIYALENEHKLLFDARNEK
jgi:hypothetical protein